MLVTDARGHGDSDGRAMDFGWYGEAEIVAAVSHLGTSPDVEPDRIGVLGLSMGGAEAIGAIGADPRIAAAVAEGATARTDADTGWLSEEYGLRGWFQERLEWAHHRLTDLLTDVSRPPALADAVAAAAPRPVLLIAAGDLGDETDAAEHPSRRKRACVRTMQGMARETRGAMWRRTLALVGALLLAVGACLVFLIVAMRTKSPRLLGAVRRFNRAFTNKLQRQLAGRPGAYASVIRHRGRTSGRSYETPVVPFATDDGFLIALPYGPNTDWLKNVLASGSAILVTEGRTYTIGRPEIIPTDMVKDVFPLQRAHIVGAHIASAGF